MRLYNTEQGIAFFLVMEISKDSPIRILISVKLRLSNESESVFTIGRKNYIVS